MYKAEWRTTLWLDQQISLVMAVSVCWTPQPLQTHEWTFYREGEHTALAASEMAFMMPLSLSSTSSQL